MRLPLESSPLVGVSILTLAVNVPGPAAAARLRQWGAVVTKIEPPSGDPLALAAPAWYAELQQGIEVISLDLKMKDGRAQLEARLAESDLLLTATRPASLARLGLDWPSLPARHPRLCHVAIIGYPPPAGNKAGHDLTYQATLGLLTADNQGKKRPELPRTLLADLAGAERAASAALALLLARERGQPAGYAQVSLAEAAESFIAPWRHGLTHPGGLLGGGLPGYNIYPAQDGWVAVAALEPHFWQRLVRELALEIQSATAADLERIFATRPAAEWQAWAAARDLPIVEIRD